jgi:hypothetical protein
MNSLQFGSSSTKPHQNIVGKSLEDAKSTLASLTASGVRVRVVRPGQVLSFTPNYFALTF